MKTKIDRRTFIKLMALTSLGSLTLLSCQKPQKLNMTCSELLDYSIVKYNNEEEKIDYVISDGYGKYYALELNNQKISSRVIYDFSSDKNRNLEKEITDNFINALNVSYMEPALISLEENIGPKYEYDAADLQTNLDKIKNELKVQTKTLSK